MVKKNLIRSLLFLAVGALGITSWTQAQTPRNDFIENGKFIHIPGPSPIIKPGPAGSWDEICTETSDALKDYGTYYLFYHGFGTAYNYGTGGGTGYQLGIATSKHPLGPFTKYEGNPVVKVGPKGGWEDVTVACAMVLKESTDKYYMWYSAKSSLTKRGVYGIGLATASSLLGPWEKYEGNPVLEDFGYVGGAVRVDGKYYLYSAYPIGSTGVDYSPMAVAVADAPEGPWIRYEGNPVVERGEWGEWDDGGFSEAEVLYHAGVFHLFYGGAKLYAPRRLTRESIGYAYSFDGFNWKKYGLNPVITREACPQLACFAEVHAIFEQPFIYLYHTIRYKEALREGSGKTYDGWSVDLKSYLYEDLGVQVLATQTPFSLDMPVIDQSSLAPGSATSWDDAPHINLSTIDRLSVTVRCTYGPNAKKGVRIHLRSSPDGLRYDSGDLYTFDNLFQPGQEVQKTFELDARVRFVKIVAENLDDAVAASDVNVTATLSGS